MSQEKIAKLHADQQEWRNQIAFYRDEIRVFEKQLGEIAMKNTAENIRSMVESFQNRFIAQTDWMDRFEHSMNVNEGRIESQVQHNPVAYARQSMEVEGSPKANIEREAEMFNTLKQEFYRFISEHY